MVYNLTDKLVVAVSSRALFDLETENKVFEQKGLDKYYRYQSQLAREFNVSRGCVYRAIKA